MSRVDVDYGVNLAAEVTDLVLNVEQSGIDAIHRKEKEIDELLAFIDSINLLKEAMLSATKNGQDVIDFNKDPKLKKALEKCQKWAPGEFDFVPADGKLEKQYAPDIQRLLEAKTRGPTTKIEAAMIDVNRKVLDQQAIVEAARDAVKDFHEAVRYWLRNSVK